MRSVRDIASRINQYTKPEKSLVNEIVENAKRPIIITVICVLGVIGGLITVPVIFSPIAREIGAWYPPFLALSAVIGLICMIGLWQMKKWAAYTYTGFAAFGQVAMLVMGIWSISSLLIPGIIVVIVLANVSKMT